MAARVYPALGLTVAILMAPILAGLLRCGRVIGLRSIVVARFAAFCSVLMAALPGTSVLTSGGPQSGWVLAPLIVAFAVGAAMAAYAVVVVVSVRSVQVAPERFI